MWIIPLVFPVEKVGKTLLTLIASYPQYFTVFMHVFIRVKQGLLVVLTWYKFLHLVLLDTNLFPNSLEFFAKITVFLELVGN